MTTAVAFCPWIAFRSHYIEVVRDVQKHEDQTVETVQTRQVFLNMVKPLLGAGQGGYRPID